MSMVLDFHSSVWVRALSRAVSAPVSVRVGFSTNVCASYRVRSRDSGFRLGARDGYYSVVISLVGGCPAGHCSCLGFLSGNLCWHIACAVQYHSALIVSGARRPLSPVVHSGVVSVGH